MVSEKKPPRCYHARTDPNVPSATGASERYFPTYDGNGNVSEYLNSAQNNVAHYEYDPFGNAIISNGAKANDFAHRFSTKYLDSESGLYYYGLWLL